MMGAHMCIYIWQARPSVYHPFYPDIVLHPLRYPYAYLRILRHRRRFMDLLLITRIRREADASLTGGQKPVYTIIVVNDDIRGAPLRPEGAPFVNALLFDARRSQRYSRVVLIRAGEVVHSYICAEDTVSPQVRSLLPTPTATGLRAPRPPVTPATVYTAAPRRPFTATPTPGSTGTQDYRSIDCSYLHYRSASTLGASPSSQPTPKAPPSTPTPAGPKRLASTRGGPSAPSPKRSKRLATPDSADEFGELLSIDDFESSAAIASSPTGKPAPLSTPKPAGDLTAADTISIRGSSPDVVPTTPLRASGDGEGVALPGVGASASTDSSTSAASSAATLRRQPSKSPSNDDAHRPSSLSPSPDILKPASRPTRKRKAPSRLTGKASRGR